MPDRLLAAEEPPLNSFADDHDRPGIRSIPFVEQPPCQQRYSQSPEVAARCELPSNLGRPFSSRNWKLGSFKTYRPVVACERHHDGRPGLLNIRKGFEGGQCSIVELAAHARIAIPVRRDLNLHSKIGRASCRETV